MMPNLILSVPDAIYDAVRRHLLPPQPRVEEAAFLYATDTARPDGHRLECHEWWPVPPDGFASRSAHHLELTDATRASIIKRAHDLGACLVELHSHVGPWPAQFSPSDLAGFADFVPHVFWRLKNCAYAAVVFAQTGIDAFIWTTDPRSPERLTGIDVGSRLIVPTGLSPLTIDDVDDQ
jgi:hypothetical protein